MSSLQRRVMEATSSATTSTQPNNNAYNNATNIEACFYAGLDLSDFGGSINSTAANTATSASAALAKIKRDASERIRREEQEECDLERRVAAVGSASVNHDNEQHFNNEVMPRALHPSSQPSSLAGEERNSNFIQFQTTGAGGNGDFLSSLVTTHKTEGREISNKSRMMLKSNSKGKVKLGQRSGVSSRQPRQTNNNYVKQKTSGKSVVKKSFKSKSKYWLLGLF